MDAPADDEATGISVQGAMDDFLNTLRKSPRTVATPAAQRRLSLAGSMARARWEGLGVPGTDGVRTNGWTASSPRGVRRPSADTASGWHDRRRKIYENSSHNETTRFIRTASD